MVRGIVHMILRLPLYLAAIFAILVCGLVIKAYEMFPEDWME